MISALLCLAVAGVQSVQRYPGQLYSLPDVTAAEQARLGSRAMLHVQHRQIFGEGAHVGDLRPWYYDPEPLPKEVVRVLDPLMRREGFTRPKGTKEKPWGLIGPNFFVEFSVFERPSRTRIAVVLYSRYQQKGDTIAWESQATVTFNRKRSGWILDPKATKFEVGE